MDNDNYTPGPDDETHIHVLPDEVSEALLAFRGTLVYVAATAYMFGVVVFGALFLSGVFVVAVLLGSPLAVSVVLVATASAYYSYMCHAAALGVGRAFRLPGVGYTEMADIAAACALGQALAAVAYLGFAYETGRLAL